MNQDQDEPVEGTLPETEGKEDDLALDDSLLDDSLDDSLDDDGPADHSPEDASPPDDSSEDDSPEDASPPGEPPQPRVVPSVKPGLFRTAWLSCTDFFAAIKLPAWNLQLFSWTLLGLVIIIVLVGNWSPMRLYFIGIYIQFPKTAALLITLAIGFLAGWLAATRRQERDE